MSERVARVVLDSPLPQLDRVFEYAVPEELTGRVAAGMRVKVPLRSGGRIVPGYVLGVSGQAEYSGRLAQLAELVSEAPVLTAEIAQLARAVANRQAGTMSDVLRLAIPARSARIERCWLEEESARRAARSTEAATVAAHSELLERLYDNTAFPERGLRAALRVPVGMHGKIPRALAVCVAVAARALARGESALLLVPDFRDLEVALAAAREMLPEQRIRSFDARLKPMLRYEQFLRTLEPRAQLIVGTRPAVYAPAHRLGTIVMWDDGDDSFAEPHAPYAHTREVALMRAEQQGCELVLAAHAPSLESRRLVASRWLREIIPLRAQHPRIIPTAATLGNEGAGAAARIPSAAWRAASEAVKDGPVLVQVGRVGYRLHLACAGCHTVASCVTCGGGLEQAERQATPSCSVCGRVHAQWRCPECGDPRLRAGTVGHERTAEELGRAFPNTRIVIADGAQRLVRVEAVPQLVVATRGAEPVPEDGWRAVLLLDTAGALARESLNATVEAMRAWSNAAALAREGAPVLISGEISTPIVALRDWQQPGWADRELAQRRELAFPPAVRVGVVTGSADELAGVLQRVRDLDDLAVQILGPVSLPDTTGSGQLRAVLRFGYRDGARLAGALRAELIAQATARSRVRGSRASTLRVRLDASEVF